MEEKRINNLSREVANLMKMYRQIKGITQAELARKMNVPQSTVARIESLDTNISSGTLEEFVKLADVNFDMKLENESVDMFEICEYIFNKGKQLLMDNYDITNMKLNKLLYFIQLEYVGNGRAPLIKHDFRGWTYGPVHLEVYNRYRSHGSNVIVPSESIFTGIRNDDVEIIDRVLNERRYMYKSAHELMLESHKEPWIKAREKGENVLIDLNDMRSFYGRYR